MEDAIPISVAKNCFFIGLHTKKASSLAFPVFVANPVDQLVLGARREHQHPWVVGKQLWASVFRLSCTQKTLRILLEVRNKQGVCLRSQK